MTTRYLDLSAVTAQGRQQGLLDECLRGDHQAWSKLHAEYAPVAASFLRSLGVRDPELDDAVQEVFLQLFRYLSRFRREAELSTWLYRLCITQARRSRRRTRLTELLSRAVAFRPPQVLVSTPALPEDIARRRVEAALGALSEGERTVFVLYEMQGLAGKEIARIVDCPEATVWRRLHYAREKFTRAIGLHAA